MNIRNDKHQPRTALRVVLTATAIVLIAGEGVSTADAQTSCAVGFAGLHGQEWREAVAKIELISENMDMRQVFEKAAQFIAEHRAPVEAALGVKPNHA